jgi:hypothetical protein
LTLSTATPRCAAERDGFRRKYELGDLIITAAVATAAVAGNADDASDHFNQRLATVITRAGLDDGRPPAGA